MEETRLQFTEVGQLLREYFDDEHSTAECISSCIRAANSAEFWVHVQLSDQLLLGLWICHKLELITQWTNVLSEICWIAG